MAPLSAPTQLRKVELANMKILKILAGLVSAYAVWSMIRRSRPVTPAIYSGGPLDAVDEAIDDSFPASDPPSHTGAHA